MSQPPPSQPRQRHYRHHKGPSTQRNKDSAQAQGRPTPSSTSSKQPHASGQGSSDCQLIDRTAVREKLRQILEVTKTTSTGDKIDTQDLVKTVHDVLSQACSGLSASSQEDVGLMCKAVFSVFSIDLLKSSNPSTQHRILIEALCAYFIMAFKDAGIDRIDTHASKDSNPIAKSALVPELQGLERVDILRSLSAALFENGACVGESLQELFQILYDTATPHKGFLQPELRRMAINCLANLVHKTGSLFASMHERMYKVLYLNLATTSQHDSNISTSVSTIARRKERASERKLISSALRALQFLLQEDKLVAEQSMPPLMDVICRFMFFSSDMIGHGFSSATSGSSSASEVIKRSSYSSYSVSGNNLSVAKSTSVGVVVMQNEGASSFSYRSAQSSDSEYSDAEAGIHQTQRKQHDGKVRLNALLCLQAIARAAPKQLQPHWAKFLTSSSSVASSFASFKAPSLISLIGSDPILTVRFAACVVLGNILESSKQYLAMAEENTGQAELKRQAGMLALSEKIGLMLRELHTGMAKAMDSVDDSMEQNVVVQMIKCCSSLVANCAYSRMRPGLSLTLYHAIKKFVGHSDPGLQLAALSFMSALFSNPSAQNDVRETILATRGLSKIDEPEFLCSLLRMVEDPLTHDTIRVEIWNTFRSVAQHHFEFIRPLWERLDEALQKGQDSEDVKVRSAGLLFLEEYSKAGSAAQVPLLWDWWKETSERHILKAFADENAAIKTLGCDCISHISAVAYDGLTDRLRILIISLVLSTAQDESAPARAAACRAIGVFILFPSLREESSLVVDMVSAALDLCRDSNLSVRVRASWAVGNFCDSLVLIKSEGKDAVLEEVLTLGMWTRVMRTALVICQDHEKLKSNGIRAIGGLLRVTFEGILERERHSLVKDAVAALVKHMEQGSLKGRWNACYAMQNVLLNPDFPIGSTRGTSYACDSDMVSWTRDVYDVLLQAIQQSKNFKVRINACAALTVPKTRAKYGDQAMFRKMVQVLMKALKNLDEEQGEHDFGEFRYRDQLESKLLRCLDHLLQLAGGVGKLDLELESGLRERIVASRGGAAVVGAAVTTAAAVGGEDDDGSGGS